MCGQARLYVRGDCIVSEMLYACIQVESCVVIEYSEYVYIFMWGLIM